MPAWRRLRLWIVVYLLIVALGALLLWWWIPREVLDALRETYVSPGSGG